MLRPPKGYEWDYLGPDPNDPSGEKWGWINEEGDRWFEPGDTLSDGSVFVCYTEDGSPIWNEVVPFNPDRYKTAYRVTPMREKEIGMRAKLARLGWKWRTESKSRIKNWIGYGLYERFKAS